MVTDSLETRSRQDKARPQDATPTLRAEMRRPPPELPEPPEDASAPATCRVPRGLAHASISRDSRWRLDWQPHGDTVQARLPGNDNVTLSLPHDVEERHRHAPRGVDMRVLFAVGSRARRRSVADFASLQSVAALAGCSRNRISEVLDYWTRLSLTIADYYEPKQHPKSKQPGRHVTLELPPLIKRWEVIGRRLRVPLCDEWLRLVGSHFVVVELPLPSDPDKLNGLLLLLTMLVDPPPRKEQEAMRTWSIRHDRLVERLGIGAESTEGSVARVEAVLRSVGGQVPGDLRGMLTEGGVWTLSYQPTREEASHKQPPRLAEPKSKSKPKRPVREQAEAERGPTTESFVHKTDRGPHRMDDPAKAWVRKHRDCFPEERRGRFNNDAAIDLITVHGDPQSTDTLTFEVEGDERRYRGSVEAYKAACA